ncbi:MAG: uncharacterized protein JWQ77_1340 [Jatrophihabitans sp.]|nr:uncharacterized protein [Jatrophihabitans sp.]
MAQSKPSSGASKRPTSSGSKPAPGTRTGPGARPPVRKPGKSIVNQKQTPWGLIITVGVIVLLVVGIVIGVVVTKKDSKSTASGGSNVGNCSKMIGPNKAPNLYLNEDVCASKISGVKFYKTANRAHVETTVTYPQTPPVGGNHSPYWADCTGTVYSEPIANENAVHMLEHGAVWITYNQSTIKPADLTALEKIVSGQDRMALSPYPNLKTPISLQSWGYQLFVNSATDPRVKEFINDLRYNPSTTPEYGATCSQPTFIANPSTFGKPLFEPAS